MPFERTQFGGNRDGPRLLITAGVHGDEFLPMLAVESLIRRFESNSKYLRGTLTLIPVVNPPAFRRGHRCGDDGLDLARTCPGREDGSPTERIAFHLSREIEKADYYVDLHTGGTELCVLPLAGYVLHPDKTILEKQRQLATAFRFPFVWGTSAELQGRSLSVARDSRVPAIYVEYLGAYREQSEILAGDSVDIESDHPLVSGCLNILRHLEMIEEPELKSEPEIMEDWRSGSGHMQACCPAPVTGFFKPRAKLGDSIAAGDLIGEIDPGQGRAIHRVTSRQDGKLVVLREYPRVNQCDAVAVVAENFGR
ncbi:MAG: succinylglutamate desuccinylase/aspartoacylase family protein [Verrucomicrobiales bacterium]